MPLPQSIPPFLRAATRVSAAGALVFSASLHVAVVSSFAFRWDAVAAVTLIPFPLWTAAGVALAVLSWLTLRGTLPVFVAALWVVSGTVCSDVTTGLLRTHRVRGAEGLVSEANPPASGSARRLRVVTLNCGREPSVAAKAVERLAPDLILFQESPHYRYIHDMAERLYGDEGSFVYGYDCSLVGRGTLVRKSSTGQRSWTRATFTLPAGRQVEVVNVHLHRAHTDLALWRPSTWQAHQLNRKVRRNQVTSLLSKLQTKAGPRPVLIGGDFNAPPSDAIFRFFANRYTDSYHAAGAGLGNSYSDRFPVIRIDYLWTTPEIRALHHEVIPSGRSDHRIVYCEFAVGG